MRMTNTQYTPGMKVRLRDDRKRTGEVVSVCKHAIEVKWNNGETREEDPWEIMEDNPHADRARAAEVQPKIDAAAATLEEAFRLWEEAKLIYTDEGGDSVYAMSDDDNIDIRKFAGTLERHGWSSSSLFC